LATSLALATSPANSDVSPYTPLPAGRCAFDRSTTRMPRAISWGASSSAGPGGVASSATSASAASAACVVENASPVWVPVMSSTGVPARWSLAAHTRRTPG